jgi:uncharacterized membrane protein
MQYITIFDYVLLPFYLALIYFIAFRLRNSAYPKTHPWRKYYIPALTVKIFGAIFVGLVYQYYYGGGDTAEFFRHAKVINSSMDESLGKWFKLITRTANWDDPDFFIYITQMEWYEDPSSYFVVSVTAFINIFTFNSYLSTSVLFAFFSFTGVWALFRTFAGNYPKLIRPVAIAMLFIPSTFVWGSGIFKDTICIFGLGWLTYGSFRILVQRDFSFKNLSLAILSFIIIAIVKLYILIQFVPALLMWVLFSYSYKINHWGVRLLIKVLFVGVMIGSFAFFLQNYSSTLGKYSLEKIATTSTVTRSWIEYMTDLDQGAGYNLGDFPPTIAGMLSKFPAAVNVALFRPYIWETKKAIVFLSAAEAFIFLFLTLKILFVLGIRKVWKTINGDATIQFCLIFSIFFAFAVGISSYNFGALSRYKIPCLPFYALALIMIYYKNRPLHKKLFAPLGI